MPLDLMRLFHDDDLVPLLPIGFSVRKDPTTIHELDDFGRELNALPKSSRLGLGARDYWRSFKNEFWLLSCTDDEKYASLRDALREDGGASQTAAISMIAAGLGATLGMVPGLLTPFVALIVRFCLRTSLEAFCSAVRDERSKPR